MTITEAVRGLTIGDCPTRREAVKTIREYFEGGDPLERIREEITARKIKYRDQDKDTYRRAMNDAMKIIEEVGSDK